MMIQDDVPKNVKKKKEQLHMRKIILRKVVCLTAAAVISNTFYAGNYMQVAARQISSAKQAAVSLQYADQTVETHQSDDSLYHPDPDNLKDTTESGDMSIKPGSDHSVTQPKQDYGKTLPNADEGNVEKNTDNSEKEQNSDGLEKEQNFDGSEKEQNTEDSEKEQNPGDSEKEQNADDAQKEQNPDDSEKEQNQDESENDSDIEDSQLDTDSDNSEKPKIKKLKKPVLKASSKPDGTIKLSWNQVKGAAEYILLCSTKKDSGFHRIYAAKNGERVYKDPGRVPGKVYYYQLAVFSKGRASRADSKKIPGRSLEKAKLTQISNVSGSRKLVLHWNTVKGADSYEILRKNAVTGKYQPIGTAKGAATSYTDSERDGGTFYSYKVYAKDANGGRGNYSQAMSQMAIDKDKKMIALTYDDGPSAYTPIVLDALAKYGGHATFFVVGTSVPRYADSVRRAAAMGCEIGNHTFDHSNLKNLSIGQAQSVINRTNQLVKELTGAEVRLLRPPYGSYNTATFAAAGMPVIMWSIDTLDWKTRSASATIQCIQQKAYDGAIVLMHDLHHPTVLAADKIMSYLKSAGYQLVTVSELAAYRGGLQNHAAYSQFRK